jgi:hypothetical protein
MSAERASVVRRKSVQEVGTLKSMYCIEIRTVPPVKLLLVAVITIDVAE